MLPVPVKYHPYGLLGDQPNIIVDGKAQRATVLTLSHWPWNDTPAPLLRDTSTAIVFAYLDAPEWHVPIGLVSNSHFDEDGLLSMYALVNPADALPRRDLMIATSRAGDFALGNRPRTLRGSLLPLQHLPILIFRHCLPRFFRAAGRRRSMVFTGRCLPSYPA